jgi:hypothetical protein
LFNPDSPSHNDPKDSIHNTTQDSSGKENHDSDSLEENAAETKLKNHVLEELEDTISLTSNEILLDELTYVNTLKNQHILSVEDEQRFEVVERLKQSKLTKRDVKGDHKLTHKWYLWTHVLNKPQDQHEHKKRKTTDDDFSIEKTITTRSELDFFIGQGKLDYHMFKKSIHPKSNKLRHCIAIKVSMSSINQVIQNLLLLICDDRLFLYDHIDSYWLKSCINGISVLPNESYIVLKLWLLGNGVVDEFDSQKMQWICQMLYDSCELMKDGLVGLMYLENGQYKMVW